MAEPPRQPREAKDLKGLLNFCMQATASEDAPNPSNFETMDPEKQRWLQEALSNMTVDVVKELGNCIVALQSPNVSDPDASEEDLDKILEALGCAADFVENIDMANNFHKLGGFGSLKSCLISPHSEVRIEAAGVVADLAQNNPYCQTHLLNDGFVPILLGIFSRDLNEVCRFKALSALSCLIRDHPESQEEFLNIDGCAAVVDRLLKSESRLTVKLCFFIRSISEENSKFRDILVEKGAIIALIELLQRPKGQNDEHEHVSWALASLLQSQLAVETVRTANLRPFLEDRLKELGNDETFADEVDHIKKILKICFSNEEKIDGIEKEGNIDR